MTKLYFVLSVREIKQLLKVAEASRDQARTKSDRKKDNHCIVLDLETVDGHTSRGAEQVSTWSLHAALGQTGKQTTTDEAS
jgi:hypothetical protein